MVLYISIVVEKSFSGDQSFRALRIVEICAKICTESRELWQALAASWRCWGHKDCSAAQPLIKWMPCSPALRNKKNVRQERDQVEEWWEGQSVSTSSHVPLNFQTCGRFCVWGGLSQSDHVCLVQVWQMKPSLQNMWIFSARCVASNAT